MLDFIDFDTFRDSLGTVKTLDWSSPSAMEGKWAWPYLEGLRWSYARRYYDFAVTPPAVGPPTLTTMWAGLFQYGYAYEANPPDHAFDHYRPWVLYGSVGAGFTSIRWTQAWATRTVDLLTSVAWLTDWPTTLPRFQACMAAAGVTDAAYLAHLWNRRVQATSDSPAMDPTNKYDCLFRIYPVGALYSLPLYMGPMTASLLYNDGLVVRWLETHNAVP